MSPDHLLLFYDFFSFPRVSGDEPSVGIRLPRYAEFSPRERG